MADAVVRIEHAAGLHARPLAAFVQVAKGFDAEIKVENLTNHKGPINGKSPLHLLMLTALRGHELRISTSGPQGDQALAALVRLVENNFVINGQDGA